MMEKNFTLVFDEVMLDQLKKLGEDTVTRELLRKLFDKMELLGPRAGELVDLHLFIYEMKVKHPPICIYFKHVKETNELYLFEYEMKTSPKKQKKTIKKVKQKAAELFKNLNQLL